MPTGNGTGTRYQVNPQLEEPCAVPPTNMLLLLLSLLAYLYDATRRRIVSPGDQMRPDQDGRKPDAKRTIFNSIPAVLSDITPPRGLAGACENSTGRTQCSLHAPRYTAAKISIAHDGTTNGAQHLILPGFAGVLNRIFINFGVRSPYSNGQLDALPH